MYALLLSIYGIAVYGGQFIKFRIAGIPITYLIILCLFISYFRFFIIKKGILSLSKGEKSLILFEIYAVLMVALSIMGINRIIASKDLYYANSFIPRQGFYIAILPACILAKENSYSNWFERFNKRYSGVLFWIIYILHIAYSGKLELTVSAVFVLSWLSLVRGGCRRTPHELLRALVICFTPIAVGGELTNLIIRFLFFFNYCFRKNRKAVIRLQVAGATVLTISLFILPFFYGLLKSVLDANSIWRVGYWRDELLELKNSKFIGVGYGTSYASINFVGSSLKIIGGPFGATKEYTSLEKLFVTGPHSSFIAVAFRLGVVGIASFLFFLREMLSDSFKTGMLMTPATVFILISAIVIIGVNVGLESPYYLMLFTFAISRCSRETRLFTSGRLLYQ